LTSTGLLVFDALIISERSFDLGVQRSLFCPISGCVVECPFFPCDSTCEDNVGDCTYAGMRVAISFFIIFRVIGVIFNILLFHDKKSGIISERLTGFLGSK
jgi:hypothetical protein